MNRLFRRALAWIALVALAGPAPARPQVALPVPDGSTPVGAEQFALQTEADDALSSQPGDRRRLAIGLWYPAEPGGEPRAWASEAMGAALAGQFPFPDGFEGGVTGHATNGPPAGEALPVVIFSPGLSFPTALYQSFFEHLASHGYAVIAVGHPHGASLVEYPDGASVTMDAWPQIEDEAERQRFLAEHAAVWEADLRAVLDWVEAGAPGSPFAGRLDAARIGLMGHSYGGTAVGRLSRDPRVDAVVAMEGAVRDPEDAESRGHLTVGAPLMHIIGGYNRLEHEGDQYRPGPDAPVWQLVIDGTGHAQLSDLIHLYSHYADADWHARHRYELEPGRVLRIAADHARAFFDRYVRGEDTAPVLLHPKSYSDRVDGPARGGYPEVELSIAVE